MLRHSLEMAAAGLLRQNAGTLAAQSLAAVWPASNQGLSTCKQLASSSWKSGSVRHFAGDANLTLQQQRSMFSEVLVARSMLPSRNSFSLQWSVQGVQFIPRSFPALPNLSGSRSTMVASTVSEQQSQMAMRVFAGRGSHALPAVQPADQALEAFHAALIPATVPHGPSLYSSISILDEPDHRGHERFEMANKIMEWRRLKMKKHKIRKRRKLNRHKNK